MDEARSDVTSAELPPAPSAFSSYSWPAVGVKAGVHAALVGVWLKQVPSEMQHNCCIFLS